MTAGQLLKANLQTDSREIATTQNAINLHRFALNLDAGKGPAAAVTDDTLNIYKLANFFIVTCRAVAKFLLSLTQEHYPVPLAPAL